MDKDNGWMRMDDTMNSKRSQTHTHIRIMTHSRIQISRNGSETHLQTPSFIQHSF